MKSIKLSILIDTFFIFIASLFFFYGVILYSNHSFLLSLLLGILLAISVSCIYIIIISVKGEIILNKKNSEIELKSFNYTLLLMKENDVLTLLQNYYKKRGVDSKIINGSLVLEEKKAQIFAIIKIENITTADILQKYKQSKKNYKTIIFGINFDDNAINLFSEMAIRIDYIKTSEAFNSLNSLEMLPDLLQISENSKKIQIKNLVKNVFTKKNAKRFLITGVFFTIFSFFTIYPVYYLIFGTILMITAVILRLYGKNKNGKIVGLETLV